jgi:hypothetical protein
VEARPNETLGVAVGEDVDTFSREHRAALTGQQFQSEDVEPYYVLFEDFTHVKFYRQSLYDGCVSQGATSTASSTWATGPAPAGHRDRPGSATAVTEASPPPCRVAAGPEGLPTPTT